MHGGFWRTPYGRDQMEAVAQDLVGRRYAVWNIGYRRVGEPGGGWPGTFDDVGAAIDHLALLHADGISMDLDQVFVAGHSAGGHLALWSASRAAPRIRVRAVAGLAPIADLTAGYHLALGGQAAGQLLGGSPQDVPGRYRTASPHAQLPLHIPQLIAHGTEDTAVPVQLSRDYVALAASHGDPVTLAELSDTSHMAFLDPCSQAHQTLCHWLAAQRANAEVVTARNFG
ncbi:alpha/beta hydrolase [Tahibacter amnicola]|uniref:Alpha/beta hydrolase n=1 Tax=Tahibacter amnicola TaxID=2976241 RepID=A0ABY6BKY5_9GAMM|nr:alpha/beta hydrolase [Tahibacter amnicola]UXI70671.1 alpha/beta hydrolase [Tahibacter amnicola]